MTNSVKKAPPKIKQKERPPQFTGWATSDEDEIRRRQWRGKTEISDVRPLDESGEVYGDYEVRSTSGISYIVEIRSLTERINSCECTDFLTNRLGTCKHIEGAVHHIRQNLPKKLQGYPNPRIEVFLDERAKRKVAVAQSSSPVTSESEINREIERLVGKLRRGSKTALDSLRYLEQFNSDSLRVSKNLDAWVEFKLNERRKQRRRSRFERGLQTGTYDLNFLNLPLLPYQIEGVLHLAFGERALLADDMGLGKTVQAVAAAMLLRNLRGIQCVLVISPASLKTEWEEQIRLFSGLPTQIVFGDITARKKAYRNRTFFTLCNYEQILYDREIIQELLHPDLIILDEAQRIKNWRTKTATEIKRLQSRYAFVLTGTPLENRIDEVYSIVDFLDSDLLGPLFRFNREYYRLNENGKPVGYKNLDKLSHRLSSIMLRRRKEDVEKDLPPRTVKNFFVPLSEEQEPIYENYKAMVGRLTRIEEYRPLTPEEFDRLQKYLACMRMVCDTAYILDSESRVCPKLDELRRVIPELLEDPDRKIIVFSEWVRMLDLIREYAVEEEMEFSWHTGSVPQHRRREEILRFREDQECRLFLSSESGGVGLNLQVADTVINIDQPWNPARLEQRISRVWRKHQERPVSVINLISEFTIEHRMLGLLSAKRALAEGVIDGREDIKEMDLPSGRAAFMEKLKEVIGDGDAEITVEDEQPSTLDQLRDDLVTEHGNALRYIYVSDDSVLIVIDASAKAVTRVESELSGNLDMKASAIEFSSYQAMMKLASSGMIPNPTANFEEFYSADSHGEEDLHMIRLKKANTYIDQAQHKLKAAVLLEGGGFIEESLVPARESVKFSIQGYAAFHGDPEPENYETAAQYLLEGDVGFRKAVPHNVIGILSGDNSNQMNVATVKAFVDWVTDEIDKISKE